MDQITNGKIGKIVNEAKEMAKKRMIDLRMAELLEKNKCWDNPSCPSAVKFEDDDNDDEEDKEDNEDNCAKVGEEDEKETSKEPILAEMSQEVHPKSRVDSQRNNRLEKEGIIEKNLSDRLAAVNKSSFKRITHYGANISIFAEEASDKDIRSKTLSKNKDTGARKKHCPFVEVMQNGKVFISKTTAVWLLQGERVSSDRLPLKDAQSQMRSLP